MLSWVANFFKKLRNLMRESKQQSHYAYRVIAIEQDQHEQYIVTVQVVNKNQVFKMRPEEILADDNLTDSFSQRDIRTLTYLGYLGIHSPKYKILAQRLLETDNRLVFAIKERGKSTPIIKTAAELSNDETILASLDQKDAHKIGYVSASEQIAIEKAQIKKLLS